MNETAGYDYALLVFRNAHNELCEDKTRGGAVKRYRCSSDSKLFSAMSPEQEWAFLQIAKAYGIITQGLGARIGQYGERTSSGTGSGSMDHGAELLSRYAAWGRRVKDLHLSAIMALAVIVEGKTMSSVDAEYKFRNGTASRNLMSCLDVWGKV